MKNIKKNIGLVILGALLLTTPSCNDFLDRQPLDGLTDKNYWASEANVRTYAWLFYNQFMGYGKGTGLTSEFYFQSASSSLSANLSDDLTANTYLAFQQNAGSANTEWRDSYEYIRRANLMLLRIPNVPMTDEAKKHWEGVARFFRAYEYFRLVQRFGGNIPYHDQFVSDPEQTDDIFIAPSTRNEIMNKVRDDINKAVLLLRDRFDPLYGKSEANAIDKYTALALKSRIGLYEGTYRKYHELEGGEVFLTDSKDASNEIIKSTKYKIQNTADSYKSVYNSEYLNISTEMILYKEYLLGIQANSIQAYTNTSTTVYGMTKAAFENYACTDGLPIAQSTQYKGDKSLADALSNRDPRLLASVDSEGLSWVGKEVSISRSRKSTTGYVLSLFYNAGSPNLITTGQNTIDAPIFSYAEVLLNHAEAAAELGNITQADLDASINLLRKRVGLPPLTYISKDDVQVDGIKITDPKRTSTLENNTGIVPSIIWEIRRERRAELMTWTTIRYQDLMRWKKGLYLDYTENPDVALGAYLGTVPEGDKATLNPNGYIMPYPTQKRVFNEKKNYLNAIPTGQIQLYKNEGITLPQNQGW